MSLEVRHLKLVATVAEEGSITRASNHLHLTQSALSHQLRDIEEKLGVTLFQRTARRMLLTPAGQRLLESARRVLQELQSAENDLRQETNQRDGLLRLTTECYTCYHWLPSLLTTFQKKFPRVEVRIVANATGCPVEALLEGDLDLAIVSDPVKSRKVVLEPLFDDEFFLVTARDHPLARKPYVTAEDLANEHLILYTDEKRVLTIYQQVLIPAGVSPRQLTAVQLTEAILEMVKAGLGVSAMAGWAVSPYVRSKQVRAVRLTRGGVRRHWKAAALRGPQRPHYIDDFIRLASRTAPKPFRWAAA